VQTLVRTILVLCVVIIAASMIKGLFWALATEMLPTSTAATAIGQINALNTWVSSPAPGPSVRSTTPPVASPTHCCHWSPSLFIACVVALWIGRVQRPSSRTAEVTAS
jgi:hypothetical protein